MTAQPNKDSAEISQVTEETRPLNEVQVRRETGGWVFETHQTQAGPFTIEGMEGIDFDKTVASQLSVDPKHVYAARLRIPETTRLQIESHNPSLRFVAEAGVGPQSPRIWTSREGIRSVDGDLLGSDGAAAVAGGPGGCGS